MIRQYADCGVVECNGCGAEIETVRAFGSHEVTAVHWCPECLDAAQERVISDLEQLALIDSDPRVAAFMRQAGLVEDPGLVSAPTGNAARPCIHAAE